jgi:catechol 2,3-dioxygenase-like lactoylglutathione lyase family enzyme
VTRRRALASEPPAFNAPGAPARVNRPAKAYERAEPRHMAHVVVLSPKIEAMRAFYLDVVGFKLTDSYPGNGYFLRCDGATDHHNLFLLKRGDAVGFHHVAFDLRDIHEVFGGGLNMQQKGWETHLGPGRHPISSAYFWYFRNPCGGAAEYDSDTDVVTDEWQPRVFQPSPQTFAEWSLEAGMSRYGGMQTTRV